MERSTQPLPDNEQEPQAAADCQPTEHVDVPAAQGRDAAALGEAALAFAQAATDAEDAEHDDPDTFPWDDAAHWRPGEAADLASQLTERQCSSEELDELFGEQPDEQVGSVDELPWYGVVRHGDRPGGYLLREDAQGFRTVHEAETDDVLHLSWSSIQREYEQFYEERDAYERVTADANGVDFTGPRIWVGSLADYLAGRLYGVWMDATNEPDDLHAATRFMLRGSRELSAEEWSIFDHEGFCGYLPSENASLVTISRIAQGIAEHGEAFAAWVNYVGDRQDELLSDESFRDHYLGQFDSMEAYVEHLLEGTGDYRYLDGLPEHLKPYVKIDVETMARDYESELYVVEASGGGVLVFDGRG